MDEELFVKLLNLRKYLDAQSDKFIASGFDINSELVSRFFEDCRKIAGCWLFSKMAGFLSPAVFTRY